MKHLLLAISTIASAVADPKNQPYVTTLASDLVVTAFCTGRPLPVDCIINNWTDTTLTMTVSKGRVFTWEPDVDELEPTTAGDSVSASPSPTPTPGESVSTNPRPTTGESGSTGSPSPTVPTTSESSAPEQSQGAAVGRHMRVAHSIMGGFFAALAIL